MANKNKLYIWTGFCPDWTDGLAFAIASSEMEAKELVTHEHGFDVYAWGNLEIRGFSKCARCIDGGS